MCEQSSCKCTPPKEDYSSIDYQLSILTAAKEGKEIEVQSVAVVGGCGGWYLNNKNIPFNFKSNRYRIKREPRTFTLWARQGDATAVELKSATPVDRQRWLNQGWERITVTEVLDA